MAATRSIEDQLDRLAALRSAPSAPGVREALAAALGNKTNLIVAKAATLASDFGRDDMGTELLGGLERFLQAPGSDKGCCAMTACAKALVDTELRGEVLRAREAFLFGARHVQMEPTWGGSVDTAGELRGLCALGLVKTGHPEVLLVLTDLLADPVAQTRSGAARALGYSGQESAVLLLRLKLNLRDKEPDVMAECLGGVLRVGVPWAIQYVAQFLDDADDAVRSAAALELGESRKPEALAPLRDRLRVETEDTVRRPILLAIAMLRTPEARETLLSLIASAKPAIAAEAVEAMGIYRADPATRAQVASAVQTRNAAEVARAFGRHFQHNSERKISSGRVRAAKVRNAAKQPRMARTSIG